MKPKSKDIRKSKVLIIATSRKTRGGITSVVKAHETGEQWKVHHCRWIETHRDTGNIGKLWYLSTALLQYLLFMPFYNIIHIHISTRVSAQRKQLFIYPASWLGKKIILHFHPSNEKFLFEEANQKLYKKLFNKATMVLALSPQWQRWIKEALDIEDNVNVLYNPCPSVNPRNDLRENTILVAGTIIPRKGYETIIKGFALIAKHHPEWKVVFIGNGEIEEAKAIAQATGVEKQVYFSGWVKGIAKEQSFQNASIYCLASEEEGFPMGVLDAWSYGIPCIMTPVGGIPDIVLDGKNGLLFNVSDFKALSDQLEKLINNEILRQSIVKESDKYVNGEFNIKTINKKLEDIYSNL